MFLFRNRQQAESLETLNLWPEDFSLESGFSSDQLDFICSDGADLALGERTFSFPWLYWSSEHYSLGRTLREVAAWPNWLPIPLASDHGIHFDSELVKYEIETKAGIHLVWPKWRAHASIPGKRVERVPHPWVVYRRARAVNVKAGAKGTIIFLPKSLPGHPAKGLDIEKFIEGVKASYLYPPPLTLCLSMHEVQRGVPKSVWELGLPVVSAGNTSSKYFVDRFYDLITSFAVATSPSVGSQLFFCEEIGVPYFIHKVPVHRPESLPKFSPDEAQRIDLIEKTFLDAEQFDKFRRGQVVSDALGLDLLGGSTNRRLRNLLLTQSVRQAPEILRHIVSVLLRRILSRP